MIQVTFVDHVLAILFGVVVPGFALLRSRRPRIGSEMEFDTASRIALYWSNSAVLWIGAIAVGVAWVVQGRTLADLGWRWPTTVHWPVATLLGTGFVVAYAVSCWVRLGSPARRAGTAAQWQRDTPFMPVTRREMAHAMALVLSAAVCEEVVFRGFLVTYLTALLGTTPTGLVLAVGLPAVAFGLAHLYQVWINVAQIVVLASILGTVFLLTGSIWPGVVAHFVIDGIGVLLSPHLLTAETANTDPSR